MLKLISLKSALLVMLLCINPAVNALSALTKNDTFPFFTTLDPHTFLHIPTRRDLLGFETERAQDHMRFSISPYAQYADIGKNMNGFDRALGDLGGRFNMIGLLFGKLPHGVTTRGPLLAEAKDKLFPIPAFPAVLGDAEDGFIDDKEQFGCFELPGVYRRYGVRGEWSIRLLEDIGITVRGGVSDICFTITGHNNLTDLAGVADPFPDTTGCPSCPISKTNTDCLLMERFCPIAKEIGLSLENFHEISIADLHVAAYWRHAFQVNTNKDTWAHLLVIPYITLEGSLALGKVKDETHAFALAFGNNGHHAVGGTAGINFDFAETIEVGCEAGVTHFFPSDYCNMFVPTSKFQSGIYPYKTTTKVEPGHNWHFGAKLSAYHFIDRLSFHSQYLLIHHEEDKIQLKTPDEAFLPHELEKRSAWKSQLINVGFNYDVSPNIIVGFLWQAPIMQRNTYRTTTLMLSLNATF